MSGETRRYGRRAQVECLLAVGAAALLLLAGERLVAAEVGRAAGRRWLLVAGAFVAVELAYVGYLLVGPARGAGVDRDSLGPANAVTLARGMLYAAAGGFLLVPPTGPAVRWAPGVCYGAGAALDFVDGRLARRTDDTSDFGERLDVAFDSLGFVAAPLVGVAWGRLPAWYLALSAARYVFLAGQWWRRRRGRPVHPLPESRLRRPLAAFQMAFVAAALVPVAPASVVHPAATLALVPSLALFARDWLAVSGRLPRDEE